MTRNHAPLHRALGIAPFGLLIVLLAVSCSTTPDGRSVDATSCPEDSSAVAGADLSSAGPRAARIRSGLLAALEFQALAATIEETVTGSCSKIAVQLGASKQQLEPKDYHPGAEAETACNVAAERILEVKKSAGGTLTVEAPGELRCRRSMADAASCLGQCAPRTPASIECEGRVSGRCQGTCDGHCVVAAGGVCRGACEGACKGACDSEFAGTCTGLCEGTCDGKRSKGACGGECRGSCEQGGEGTCGGTCSGQCSGVCASEAAGGCDGLCAGSCSRDMTEKQCDGLLAFAEVDQTCKLACESRVLANLACAPAGAKAQVVAASNAQAAARLSEVLAAELGTIESLLATSREPGLELARGSKAAIDRALLAPSAEAELSEELEKCVEHASATRADSAQALETAIQAAITLEGATR